MGILSATLVANPADAAIIGEDDDFYRDKQSRYNTASAKGLNSEMFDTLLYILSGKRHQAKRVAACKLVYESGSESTWVYQLKYELIELVAKIDQASLGQVALEILELDDTFRSYAAIGIAMPPTEYLNELQRQCKTALDSNKTILLRVDL